ncbi:MAG: NACHT domain-containing protein [Desulfobacterales bacterium]|nr:NACHT domain-containing protein [Desulfobacterales bacterium]
MAKNSRSTDSIRASHDGHEFHEAWTARKALQLLHPTDNLVGIAVEGLSPPDQAEAASETVEIADTTLYYGNSPKFEKAYRVSIVQFKYSVGSSDDYFRASHAKKTVAKFAAAYLDYKKRYRANDVREKLKFELITNRPIYPAFQQAIASIAERKPLSGDVKKQAEQFKTACGLDGKTLVEFAGKCLITGLAGSLTDTKRDLSRILVDWSATSDPMARARLGAMREMVRKKVGYAGMNRNVIKHVDVLAALDVSDVNELLPCPASLPEVGKVVEREQLAEAIKLVPKLERPLLIHAAGGVGKTVFLESLSQSLSDKHEVLLFDCFGGGAYRAPEDSRHLPKRGLVHIVNTLACRSLCDPLLPGNDNVESLFETFRRRLKQCVKTLSTASAERELILFIDAIDNAAKHADDMNQPPFPTLLLKSFHHGGSIPGVKLVVSCRSHRIDIFAKDVPYHDFKLEPFSLTETEAYVRDRLPNVTQTEIQVAQARSGGNARILEHLVTSDRGLLDKSEIDNIIELDDLLNDRIQKALLEAIARGYNKAEIGAFLAGLSVLPPPVPLDEYAGAHGMDISAIESFAADLAPLLERTKYGLMFRDELTETLIREKYGSDDDALRRVAGNLLNRQDTSVYAARALPGLLQKLNDGKQLFELAFDERFPESITSTVGKRNIRYARLKAAVLHESNNHDHNRLVHLLVELSTIAASDQRGANYILDYPDLVIAAQDVDATRRLFETRTTWPGTRHARLAIANALSGDIDDAYRHAVSADEWIVHYRQQDRKQGMDRSGPERLDVAAIPFCLITQSRAENAIGFMREWKDWYAYEVGGHLFSLLDQVAISQSGCDKTGFLSKATDDIGVIASALSFLELDDTQRSQLIKRLSKACEKEKKLETNDNFHREANYRLQDGLIKASVIAASMGLSTEALTISSRAPHARPNVWAFSDHFSDQHILPFLVYTALHAAVKGKELRERDILPNELYAICSKWRCTGSGVEFKRKLKKCLEGFVRSKQDQSKEDKKSISYELKRDAESFIDTRIEPLLKLAKAFAALTGASIKKGDQAFLALLEAWAETRRKRDLYSIQKFNRFFQSLGCQLAVFALWARTDLTVASVKAFLERLHEQEILGASTLIEVVAILAKRSHLHALAGEQALKANSLIEKEYDVSSRATLYAQLARAILPASRDEAATYFKAGLEQMDAIGSGDYQFTNELLLFASSLRGEELAEQNFHTLTNICELNMPDEEEKFPWFAFAKGLSRTSGCKALAKLARWDDRSRVSLNCTLLPYLIALIDDGKIAPEDALALLRLSNPVEFWSCNTETFAKALDDQSYQNQEILISELIQQFEDNNPGLAMDSIIETLASIAERTFGKASETTVYLSAACVHFAKVRAERNEHTNYHGRSDPRLAKKVISTDMQNRAMLRKLATRTKPNDEVSLGKAIDELNKMQHIYDLKGEFFVKLRSKVLFSDRPQYIKTISRLENLSIYTKLHELETCKGEWGKSSAALASIYESLGVPILQLHADDFVCFDQLSGHKLKELSDLSGVPITTLAMELINVFSSPASHTAASVWLGLASFICDKADDGEGQSALKRLLNSNAAKLASNVPDGEWKDGLYPTNDITEIASGLVWRMLGSPQASDRWRAAHSVRCFAKFERWKVIDALVARFPTRDAHPFQAPELTFYYMHARLWLLIALARIAMDYPQNIARYHKILMEIVLDEESPHVLMRHFAAQTILVCIAAGNLKLSSVKEKQIRTINLSPFPRLRKKLKKGSHNSFYQGRPKDVLEPKTEFHLDYDFDKYDVHGLSDVFGRPGWEVRDLISEEVHSFDPNVKSMYETGGREVSRRHRSGGMTSLYHSYGQQLGWHALFPVAGRLLRQYHVTDDWYYDDPWTEWLNRSLLTRNDGFWLSDGIDRPSLDVKVNLLEEGEKGLIITGSKRILLNLVGIGSGQGKGIVVNGNWNSPDNIDIHISSALVSSRMSKTLANELIQEEPFFVWLPTYREDETEYLNNNKKDYVPWVVCSYSEGRLDENDPLASNSAIHRPHFSENITKIFSLKSDDPFRRVWKNSSGKTMASAEAWGCENKFEDETSCSGVRFVCSGELLREVLATLDTDLLLLVKLRRYEEGRGITDSKFSHTIAVVCIKQNLDFEFYKGAVNKLHQARS